MESDSSPSAPCPRVAWLWSTLHKRQIEEINELRKDVDALLSVLDHWVTPGAGDKQRQFDYMAEVLEARNKRGISGRTCASPVSSTISTISSLKVANIYRLCDATAEPHEGFNT